MCWNEWKPNKQSNVNENWQFSSNSAVLFPKLQNLDSYFSNKANLQLTFLLISKQFSIFNFIGIDIICSIVKRQILRFSREQIKNRQVNELQIQVHLSNHDVSYVRKIDYIWPSGEIRSRIRPTPASHDNDCSTCFWLWIWWFAIRICCTRKLFWVILKSCCIRCIRPETGTS